MINRVLYLEVATIGRECGVGEIVTRTDGRLHDVSVAFRAIKVSVGHTMLSVDGSCSLVAEVFKMVRLTQAEEEDGMTALGS